MTTAKIEKRQRRHAKIRKVVKGTAARPRLVVFRSLKAIYAQLIDDTTHKTLLSESSVKLEKGKKTDKSKEVGILIAKKSAEKGITEVVFDRNGYKYHGRVKALADGAREGGLKF